MSILATNERLIAVNAEEFFNAGNRRVHFAFHVGTLIVTAIPKDTFIMDEPRRICRLEVIGHRFDIFSAVTFIAARPNQN